MVQAHWENVQQSILVKYFLPSWHELNHAYTIFLYNYAYVYLYKMQFLPNLPMQVIELTLDFPSCLLSLQLSIWDPVNAVFLWVFFNSIFLW